MDSEELLEASVLARQYHEDQPAAEGSFTDATLTVEGEVKNIANVVSAVVMRVLGTGEPDDGTHLEVLLADRSDAENISRGETVRFQGVCQGLKETVNPTENDVGWIKFEDAVVLE